MRSPTRWSKVFFLLLQIQFTSSLQTRTNSIFSNYKAQGHKYFNSASSACFLSSSPDNNNQDTEDNGRKQRLEKLGFAVPSKENEARQQKEPIKVRVDLIENVDAVTLTAVAFGLLAINFLVLANLGDIGLAGIVARIINEASQ